MTLENSLLLHKCFEKAEKSLLLLLPHVSPWFLPPHHGHRCSCVVCVSKLFWQCFLACTFHDYAILMTSSSTRAHLSPFTWMGNLCVIFYSSLSHGETYNFHFLACCIHSHTHFRFLKPFSRFYAINLHQLLHSEFNLRKKRVHLSRKRIQISLLVSRKSR